MGIPGAAGGSIGIPWARFGPNLEAAPYEPIDADAVLRSGMAALGDLPRLLESAHLEERKQLVQAFIAGVTVQPDDNRLDLRVRTLPDLGNLSVSMVAGARYEPLQMNLEPPERFLAGHVAA